MRRLALASVAVLAALVVIPSSASARTEAHFSVLTNDFGEREVGNQFRFRQQLFSPLDPSNQVGNDRVRCREGGSGKIRCRGLIKLNGEYGGFGWIYVNGNVGPGDDRLNVTGGTFDFEGAAGKVIAKARSLHFHLVL